MNLHSLARRPHPRRSDTRIEGMTLSNAPAMSKKTATVEALLKNPCCIRLVRVTRLSAQEREARKPA